MEKGPKKAVSKPTATGEKKNESLRSKLEKLDTTTAAVDRIVDHPIPEQNDDVRDASKELKELMTKKSFGAALVKAFHILWLTVAGEQADITSLRLPFKKQIEGYSDSSLLKTHDYLDQKSEKVTGDDYEEAFRRGRIAHMKTKIYEELAKNGKVLKTLHVEHQGIPISDAESKNPGTLKVKLKQLYKSQHPEMKDEELDAYTDKKIREAKSKGILRAESFEKVDSLVLCNGELPVLIAKDKVKIKNDSMKLIVKPEKAPQPGSIEYLESYLQPGDLIAAKGMSGNLTSKVFRKIIGKMQGAGEYTHIMTYMGNGMVMNTLKTGTRLMPLKKVMLEYSSKDYMVARPPNPDIAMRVLNQIKQMIGKTKGGGGYDLSQAVKDTFGIGKGGKVNDYYCTELYIKACKAAGYHLPLDGNTDPFAVFGALHPVMLGQLNK